jgi:hypothetical protein
LPYESLKVFDMFGDGEADVPYFTAAGTRNIIPHPENRPLQELTVQAYADRTLVDGMVQDGSGAPWMQYSDPNRSLPVLALTFNHRAHAVYRCVDLVKSHPKESQVTSASLWLCIVCSVVPVDSQILNVSWCSDPCPPACHPPASGHHRRRQLMLAAARLATELCAFSGDILRR